MMTNQRKIIAITGTIGAGKSAAGKILQELGADVIDADDLARQAVTPNSPGLKQIETVFGPQYINHDGTLNRQALGNEVFKHPEKLKTLNNLIHPIVNRLYKEKITTLQEVPTHHPIIYLVPLLFEANIPLDGFTEIATISTKPELAITRAMQRDGTSHESIKERMASQLSDKEKCERSTIVILNNGSLDELAANIKSIYPRFCNIDTNTAFK
jgi:dephospho-CoA kinase